MYENIPRKLNLGSGKDKKRNYINLDINPKWNPDILFDLNHDIKDKEFILERYNNQTISFDKFKLTEIIANDILEHIDDLVTCMKNCLYMLDMNGNLKIQVPYELSLGAWSDPTHKRAFNERSWIYYTDWFWYTFDDFKYRFEMKDLAFQLNGYGQELRRNHSLDTVIRVPRAIDSMSLELTKIKVTEDDIKILKTLQLI